MEKINLSKSLFKLFGLIRLEKKEITALYLLSILSGLIQLSLPLGIQAIINFVIIAFFVFVVLRAAEKYKKKEVAVPAAPAGPSQEELLTQIRDLLKK